MARSQPQPASPVVLNQIAVENLEGGKLAKRIGGRRRLPRSCRRPRAGRPAGEGAGTDQRRWSRL